MTDADQPLRPSRSSIWAAAARALGAREPDARVRNPDFLAERLLGPNELALLADSPLPAALRQPYSEALDNIEAIAAARLLIPRTRFIDSRLETALHSGTTQLVILGAGFDSRAYRFTEQLKNARVFEVDQPATQGLKTGRVRAALGAPPPNVSYVAIDFRREQLGDVLAAAGYLQDQKTFVIWEGVTMYLPQKAVEDTLRWISVHAAPQSTVIFDYTYDFVIQAMNTLDPEKLPEAARERARRFAILTAQEPWIFGLPRGGEEEFLKSVGLKLRKAMGLGSIEAVETYLTRGDGSILGRIPGTEHPGYSILEAVTPER